MVDVAMRGGHIGEALGGKKASAHDSGAVEGDAEGVVT